MRRIFNRKNAWWWLLMGAHFLSLRLYKAGQLPIGMDFDQVREAYFAIDILHPFKVISDNLLFVHLMTLHFFQKWLGLTVLSNYANATFWFIASLVPLYALLKDLFGEEEARLGTLFVMFSLLGSTAPRIAQIGLSVLPFAFLSLWAFYRVLRTEEWKYTILLGLVSGVGFFSFPAFKGVLVTIAFLLLAFLSHKALRTQVQPLRRTLFQFGIVTLLFFSIVTIVIFGFAGHTFCWREFSFILFQYSSNGSLTLSLGAVGTNIANLLSAFLPVSWSSVEHFLIPHYTGSGHPLFYISPIVSLLFIAFWGLAFSQIVRFIRRNKQKETLSSWPEELNWIFAVAIFVGGSLPALLSDCTPARRWMYAWFWLYALAAVTLHRVFKGKRKIFYVPLVTLVLGSELLLFWNPYLLKPWRTVGPSQGIMTAINEECMKGGSVGVTPEAYHWVRHYMKVTPPPRNCQLERISHQTKALPSSFVLFGIDNAFMPISLNSLGPPPLEKVPTLVRPPLSYTCERPKTYGDAWGFRDFFLAECTSTPPPPPKPKKEKALPTRNEKPLVHVILQTDLGEIKLMLNARKAPVTTENFLRYLDEGFYEGGLFHQTVRLDNQPVSPIAIEVIQAGVNPQFEKKMYSPIRIEVTEETGLRHADGTISMARDDPHTATGDFFICVGPQPELDFGGRRNADGYGFAAFGKVVDGMDVVQKIQKSTSAGQKLTPPIRIIKAYRRKQ